MLRFSKTIIFLAFLLFIAGLIFLEVGVSFAKENPTVTFIPQVSIGEEFIAGKAVKITGTTLAKYIMAFYKWAIRAITIIAVVMLMIGGFQWMMAGGNANIVGQAKARMASALAGLVLVLGAYLLLNFVNPALTRFRSLDIAKVAEKELRPNLTTNPIRCAQSNDYYCGVEYTENKDTGKITEVKCCGTKCPDGSVCVGSVGTAGGILCPQGVELDQAAYYQCQRIGDTGQQGRGEVCRQTCGTQVVYCFCPPGTHCGEPGCRMCSSENLCPNTPMQ